MRVNFARDQINYEFESGSEYLCPSVHSLELSDPMERVAILGWLVQIHGQAGPSPNYLGVYENREKFYQELRDRDFLFSDWSNLVTDQQLLALWKR